MQDTLSEYRYIMSLNVCKVIDSDGVVTILAISQYTLFAYVGVWVIPNENKNVVHVKK